MRVKIPIAAWAYRGERISAARCFDLLAWVIPLGGALAAAIALALGARAWSRTRSEPRGPAPVALGPEDERRVDEALEHFDD